MPNHIVQQGQYLSMIAKSYGIADYRVIWNHGNNADLKAKRKSPNVLYPGDVIFIPEKVTKEESRATDARHEFTVPVQSLKLALVLHDLADKPIESLTCTLLVETEKFSTPTDGSGKLTQKIAIGAGRGQLMGKDKDRFIDINDELLIGHLDPVEQFSGQRDRLRNLGYAPGPWNGAPGGPDEDRFRSAVEEFQCDRKLTVDGICGPMTQAKLKEVHGC